VRLGMAMQGRVMLALVGHSCVLHGVARHGAVRLSVAGSCEA